MRPDWEYPQLWAACEGAWCPSRGSFNPSKLIDLSGKQHHGTYKNMSLETDISSNGGGTCLVGDGVNNYLEFGTINEIKPAASTLTVCCWMNRTGTSTHFGLISYRQSGGWAFYAQSGALGSLVYYDGATSWTAASGIASGDNRWLHVSLRATQTTFQFSAGQTIGVITGGASKVAGGNTVSAMGWDASPSGPATGYIDDMRVYSRWLSDQEIRLLASERAISYRLAKPRRGVVQAAPATRNDNLLLLGVS